MQFWLWLSFLSNDKGWNEATGRGKARLDPAQGGTCLPGCLVEGGSRIQVADVSFPKLEVSLWLALHHQKKKYRMSPKIKKGINIPPHVAAYKSVFPNLFFCFYSNKRGCNSWRNQAFWFYWLVTLFSNQYPGLNNYPSILEQFRYSDNSVMLNIECMLFSNFPLIYKMQHIKKL